MHKYNTSLENSKKEGLWIDFKRIEENLNKGWRVFVKSNSRYTNNGYVAFWKWKKGRGLMVADRHIGIKDTKSEVTLSRLLEDNGSEGSIIEVYL